MHEKDERKSKKESKDRSRDKSEKSERRDKDKSRKNGDKADSILASLMDDVKKSDTPIDIHKVLAEGDEKEKKSKKSKKEKKEKSKKRKRDRSESASRSRSRSRSSRDKKKRKKDRKDRDSDVELSPWRRNLIEETLGVKLPKEETINISDEDDLPLGSDYSTIKASTSKNDATKKEEVEEKDEDLETKIEEAFPLSKEKFGKSTRERSASPTNVFDKLIKGEKPEVLKKVTDQDKDKSMMPRNIKIQLKTTFLPKVDSENGKKEVKEEKDIKQESPEIEIFESKSKSKKKKERDDEKSSKKDKKDKKDGKGWATLDKDEEKEIKELRETLKKMKNGTKKKESDDDMSISGSDSVEEIDAKISKSDVKKENREKSKSKSKRRSPSSSRSRSRSRSDSSRSRSRSKSRSRSRSRNRRRSRDRRRKDSRSRSRSRSRSYSRGRSRSRSRSRSRDRRRRDDSRSRRYDRDRRDRGRHDDRRRGGYDRNGRRRPYAMKPIPPPRKFRTRQLEKLDKDKLLEIATRNATRMAMEGKLPDGMEILETIKHKSVDQLVKICKQLQEDKEIDKNAFEAVTSDEDEKKRYETYRGKTRRRSRTPTPDDQFRSRPVKSSKIEINISNAVALPTRSHQQLIDDGVLRLSFPVSSGAAHRNKVFETQHFHNEWVPVEKPKMTEAELQMVRVLENTKVNIPIAYKDKSVKQGQPGVIGPALMPTGMKSDTTALPPPPAPPNLDLVATGSLPPPPKPPETFMDKLAKFACPDVTADSLLDVIHQSSGLVDGLEKDVPLTFRLPKPPEPPKLKPEDLVFGVPRNLKTAPKNMPELVAKRAQLNAQLLKKPHDQKLQRKIAEIDDQMSAWAESKNLPGHFAGSTGVRVLRPEELDPIHPKYHAWAKKDMFKVAEPVRPTIGMKILQKYGWKPGKGLGKEEHGQVDPLLVEVKPDKKGLASEEDKAVSKKETVTSINGKHPISMVMEVCNKRGWRQPDFTCIEMGPQQAKRFLWKALLNGVEYEPSVPSTNKKAGKSQVCLVILQSLGVI